MKYIELVQNLSFYSIDKLREKLNHYKKAIKRYAYIIHDKDINKSGEPREPHFHCAIEFNEKTYTFERISKMFDIEPQYIEKPKKKGEIGFNNILGYLTHSTDNSQAKYSYNENLVISNFDYVETMEKIRSSISEIVPSEEKVLRIIDDYANFMLTERQLFAALGFLTFDKYYKHIQHANIYRNKMSKIGDRDMKVIYITGGTGSGKTTLAKFIAHNLGFECFVSGSGDDVLDGYENEPVIILDDLRGDVFKKNELFKLTDNNTGSGVKSRYYNKFINKCRILIITSIEPPKRLYDWVNDSENEKPQQFARRLGYQCLEIYGEKIFECKLDKDLVIVDKKESVDLNMPLVFAVEGIVKDNESIGSLMFEVSKKARKTLEKQSDDLPF